MEEAILTTQLSEPDSQKNMAAVASSSTIPSADVLASQEHAVFIPLRKDNLTDRSLLDAFLNLYQPSAPENRSGVTIAWLTEVCSLDEPSPVLQLALYSLAASGVAAAGNGDVELSQTSRHYYGRALRTLNDLLTFKEVVFDDPALAAVRCFMIYEVAVKIELEQKFADLSQ